MNGIVGSQKASSAKSHQQDELFAGNKVITVLLARKKGEPETCVPSRNAVSRFEKKGTQLLPQRHERPVIAVVEREKGLEIKPFFAPKKVREAAKC